MCSNNIMLKNDYNLMVLSVSSKKIFYYEFSSMRIMEVLGNKS